jgi:hypothetical protein
MGHRSHLKNRNRSPDRAGARHYHRTFMTFRRFDFLLAPPLLLPMLHPALWKLTCNHWSTPANST